MTRFDLRTARRQRRERDRVRSWVLAVSLALNAALIIAATLLVGCAVDTCRDLDVGCTPPPAPAPLPTGATQARWAPPNADGGAAAAAAAQVVGRD